MEKTKSDKKKEKAKSKVNLITSNEELRTGGANPKKPIIFDPSLTEVEVPFVHVVPLSHIIEALKDNDTVTSLTVSPRSKWDKKDFKELVTCLSGENRGIKKLVIRAIDFEPLFMEAICKILKANPRIQTLEITGHNTLVTNRNGVKLFCDSMQHFKFSEFIVRTAVCETHNLLLESLKSLKSLKILEFHCETDFESIFPAVCDVLASSAISEFRHWGGFLDEKADKSCAAFKRALTANKSLKKLKLERPNYEIVTLLFEELRTNTMISDVTLKYATIPWKYIGQALRTNKTLKRLDLRDVAIHEDEILFLDLGSNATLTDLTIAPSTGLDYTKLFTELCKNQTIQKLEVDSNEYMTPDPIKKYLIQNHSLRELKIGEVEGNKRDETYSAIGDALRVNTTLKKIGLKMVRASYESFLDLIEGLKINTSITHIDLGRRLRDIGFDKAPINGNSVDDFLVDLLKTNKSLRFIEGASEYPYLEVRLKENREAQDRAIRDTCLFIKMIVAKPAILPLEIWLQIFNHLKEGYFDFADFSRKELNKLAPN